jgi:hypothetical protein
MFALGHLPRGNETHGTLVAIPHYTHLTVDMPFKDGGPGTRKRAELAAAAAQASADAATAEKVNVSTPAIVTPPLTVPTPTPTGVAAQGLLLSALPANMAAMGPVNMPMGGAGGYYMPKGSLTNSPNPAVQAMLASMQMQMGYAPPLPVLTPEMVAFATNMAQAQAQAAFNLPATVPATTGAARGGRTIAGAARRNSNPNSTEHSRRPGAQLPLPEDAAARIALYTNGNGNVNSNVLDSSNCGFQGFAPTAALAVPVDGRGHVTPGCTYDPQFYNPAFAMNNGFNFYPVKTEQVQVEAPVEVQPQAEAQVQAPSQAQVQVHAATAPSVASTEDSPVLAAIASGAITPLPENEVSDWHTTLIGTTEEDPFDPFSFFTYTSTDVMF